jgi:hypothetical protein
MDDENLSHSLIWVMAAKLRDKPFSPKFVQIAVPFLQAMILVIVSVNIFNWLVQDGMLIALGFGVPLAIGLILYALNYVPGVFVFAPALGLSFLGPGYLGVNPIYGLLILSALYWGWSTMLALWNQD